MSIGAKELRSPRSVLLVIVVAQVLALPGCQRADLILTPSDQSVVIASPVVFARLRRDSAAVARFAKIGNPSERPVHISRWVTSCECLTIEPSSVEVPAHGSTIVRVSFDPSIESGFVGDLLISVDAFGAADRVASFEVSISILPPEDGAKDEQRIENALKASPNTF